MKKIYLLITCLLATVTVSSIKAQPFCADNSQPEIITTSLAGMQTNGGAGDADNTTRTATFSGPVRISGIAWNDVVPSPNGASWCSEVILQIGELIDLSFSFEDSSGPCTDVPSGSGGVLQLEELGLGFESTGTVSLESIESFDDTGLNPDATITSGTVTLYGCPTGVVLLPVDLVSFVAVAADKTVDLTWSTASESGNEGFAVERSADGRSWARVGWVPGSGDSEDMRYYDFIDENVAPATSYFYRLRQNDLDGTFAFSDVVSVSTGIAEGESVGEVFPNPAPADQGINLPVISSLETRSEVHVLSLDGKQVRITFVSLVEGVNRVQVPTEGIPPGVYLLRTTVDGKPVIRKFTIGR